MPGKFDAYIRTWLFVQLLGILDVSATTEVGGYYSWNFRQAVDNSRHELWCPHKCRGGNFDIHEDRCCSCYAKQCWELPTRRKQFLFLIHKVV